MRKSIICFISIICSIFIFCQNVFSQNAVQTPSKNILNGIWQGKDRLILFENTNSEIQKENELEFDFSVVLRVFYGWYDDRAAENPKFKEIKTRDKNDAEARPPENISIRCKKIFENESKNAGVYELELIYPSVVYSTGRIAKPESVFVPIAVIEDKIYLDFLINPKFEEYEEENEKKIRILKNEDNSGFWRCASNADGITISPPRFKNEVKSYYIVKNQDENGNFLDEIYRLRYWKSGMDYDADSIATFTDSKVFEISKFLKIGSDIYQCTTGRSSKVRNIEKSDTLPSNSIYDSDFTICAFGNPYLIRVPNGNSKEDLLKIVEENNKRRKAPPKPLFPISEIDFHWKEISELEKYNPFTWNRRNIDLGK